MVADAMIAIDLTITCVASDRLSDNWSVRKKS